MAATRESPDTRLLTVREAAAVCRCSVPHAYRLIARGEIPAVRVGEQTGPIRVPESELRAWLYGPPKGRA